MTFLNKKIVTIVTLLVAIVALLVIAGLYAGLQTNYPNSVDAKQNVVSSFSDKLLPEISGELFPKMIELYTPHCPSCSEMKLIIENIANQCNYKGVVVETYDISTEANEHLMDKFNVKAVPTLLFIDETGVEISRLIGKQSETTIKQALSDLRGEQCPAFSPVSPLKKNIKPALSKTDS